MKQLGSQVGECKNINKIENKIHVLSQRADSSTQSKNYSPRLNYKKSYLAQFSKIVNGEDHFFHKWLKSKLNHSHIGQDVHQLLIKKKDDGQLEVSGFVSQFIKGVILELYKVKHIQDSA